MLVIDRVAGDRSAGQGSRLVLAVIPSRRPIPIVALALRCRSPAVPPWLLRRPSPARLGLMPRIPAVLSNFGGAFAGANGHHDMLLSREDIVRAAITTGYPNLAAATMPATFHRTWAVLYRASIVLAYLDAPAGDRIVRSDDYNRADRSEKGSISYYLGLFGAKLGAEAFLRTPWMWHYDAYHRLAHGVGPIARRPDLIGRATTGEWITVEAKGRTNGWTDELRTAAKDQAQAINQIVHPGGAVDDVEANVASLSFFDGEGWCLLMDDPPARTQPLRLTAVPDELYRAYYRPVLDYVGAALQSDEAQSVRVVGVDFKVAYDRDLDLFVGLASAIIETEGADIERIRDSVSEILALPDRRATQPAERLRDDQGSLWSMGPDGVIVRLGDRWQ